MTIHNVVARLCWAGLIAVAMPLMACAADEYTALRQEMVDKEIVAAGVKDPRVVQAMRDTPRHEFVDARQRPNAYYDMALAIGNAQTISPPFIVAYMTEQLLPKPNDKVLEIGTGSGFQAAVLSPLVKEVYSIEIVRPLGEKAARTLKRLKYENVFTKVGDGYEGWPEHAPFDKIIVTCSPEDVPVKLVEQLREGGRMLVPVGERYQQTLYSFEKKDGKLIKEALLPMLFVPMTGAAEDGRVVLPDPERPAINNGGFERFTSTAPVEASAQVAAVTSDAASEAKPTPVGWHYQRHLEVVSGNDASEGSHFVRFRNDVPGRGAQALQGLAVDGRKVHRLNLSAWVKANQVRPGENAEQQAIVAITFYDEARAQISYKWIGPFRDSFDWRQFNETIGVPSRAREAIVRIGLCGAVGEVCFDDIRVTAAK